MKSILVINGLKNIIILDGFLKESSFTKASQLTSTEKVEPQKIKETVKEAQNSIPITQGKDGKVIANAFVTPEQVSIVLDDNVEISADTPPFKSFFLDRIIGEMKKKDSTDAENGKIQRESVIDYIINKNGSDIREIIIKKWIPSIRYFINSTLMISSPVTRKVHKDPCKLNTCKNYKD